MTGIKETKQGYFRIDKIYKGIRIVSSKSSYQDAENYLLEKMKSIDDGTFERAKKEETKGSYEYFKKTIKNCKPSTKYYKISIYNNFLVKLMPKNILQCTNETFKNIYDKLYSQRFRESVYSLNNAIIILRQIVQSINNDYDMNIKLSYMDKIKISNDKSERVDQNFLEYNDYLTLRKAIIDSKPSILRSRKLEEYILLMDILYYTGCRISEVRAFKKNSFVIKQDRFLKKQLCGVNVIEQVQPSGVKVKGTKTNINGRFVLLDKNIFDSIIKQIENLGLSNNDYIFINKNNVFIENISLIHFIEKNIKRLKEENKLPATFIDHISPHGFRYSNGLYLKYVLKISDELAAKNQGHSLSMHLDIYSRVARSEIDDKFGF